MPNARSVTLPIPRCPICDAVMEEAQLTWKKARLELRDGVLVSVRSGWEETWGCDSCHSLHTFPARLAFLEYARNSGQLPQSNRTLFLPK